jgi:hypothetical protein
MIDYLRLEWRLAGGGWAWLLPAFFGVLRVVRAVGPGEGWVGFLFYSYPLVLAAAALHLLDQERRWKTGPVLSAAPRSRGVLATRLLLFVAPLLAVPFVIVAPRDALDVIAPACLLSAAALVAGLTFGLEWGAAAALAWWTVSFLSPLAGLSVGQVGLHWLSIIGPLPCSGEACPVIAGGPALSLARLGLAVLLFVLPATRWHRCRVDSPTLSQ